MKTFLLALLIPLSAFAETVTVSWDANTESDLAGYNIYYGTSSGSYDNALDVGNNVSWFVNNLTANAIYYFAVTAYDFSRNESGFSDEVSTTIKPDIDNRPPSLWRIIWNSEVPFEEIVLEIVAYGNESQDATGWTIWGRGKGNVSGLYILNPEKLLVGISFDAQLIGRGECLDDPKMVGIGSEDFFIGTTWRKVDSISNEERIFISFLDDCWIPETKSDANIRIKNIHIFR